MLGLIEDFLREHGVDYKRGDISIRIENVPMVMFRVGGRRLVGRFDNASLAITDACGDIHVVVNDSVVIAGLRSVTFCGDAFFLEGGDIRVDVYLSAGGSGEQEA